jgi:hypothetical protein
LIGLSLALGLLGLAIAYVGAVAFFQRRLLFPRPSVVGVPARPEDALQVWLPIPAGRVEAWYLAPAGAVAGPAPVIVCSGLGLRVVRSLSPEPRIVTSTPLEQLWGEQGELAAKRVGSLGRDAVRDLVRLRPVHFVVASVGAPLRWIEPAATFDFWKNEAAQRIADADGFRPGEAPSGLAYVASLWDMGGDSPAIILLESHH